MAAINVVRFCIYFSCTEIEEFGSVRPAFIAVWTALNLHRYRGYGQHRNRGYGPALNAVRFCTEIEVSLECTACIYYCTVGSKIKVLFMHRNRDSLLLVKNLG